MMSIASVVKQLKQKWLSSVHFHPQVDSLNQPLLDKNAILDLYYRALRSITANQSTMDLAHRLPGDTRSVFRGTGLDFEESRPYQWGDELRYMNWRLMARTSEPYMKVFSEERRRSIFIVVDQRGPMCFGTRVRLKATQAARVAAILAFAAQQQNIEVSGVILKNRPIWLEACNDEQSVFHFVNRVSQACAQPSSSQQAPTINYISRLLHPMLSRGSQLVFISDFYDLDADSSTPLLPLCLAHAVKAIHIIDPAEMAVPKVGKLAMQALNKVQTINSMDQELARQYQQAALQHRETRAQLLRSMGIEYIRILTDTDAIENALHINRAGA